MLTIPKTTFFTISILVLAAAWVVAGPLVADTNKCGHITSDQTWGPPEDTVYVICPQGVYIDPGVTVTVLPGVTVKFLSGTSFLQVDGTLKAVGTEVDKILFTSSKVAPKAGDWSQILFTSTCENCEMACCEVAWGGAFGVPMVVLQGAAVGFDRCAIHDSLAALVYTKSTGSLTIADSSLETCGGTGVDCDDASSLTMTRATVSKCMLSGVRVDGGSLVMDGCTLKDNKEAAGAITGTMSALSLTGNSAWGNDLNGLVVTLCQVPVTATITSTGSLPLVVGGDTATAGLTFPTAGTTITVNAGSIVKFLDSDYSRIYSVAALNVAGTEAEPVVFTSIHDDSYGGDTDAGPTPPAPGDWGCVRVAYGTSATVRGAVLACGGARSDGSLVVEVAASRGVEVSDSSFAGSSNSGVGCTYAGGALFSQCTFGGNVGAGIRCRPYSGAVGPLRLAFCVASGNGGAGIDCDNCDPAPTIDGCVLMGNKSCGVRSYYDYGGGARSPTVRGCVVSGNAGRGVYVCRGTGPTVEGCTIYGTTGSPGHGIVLEDCAGTAQLVTCANNAGSGVYCTSRSPLVNSGIFAHNGRYGVESDGVAWPTVQYSTFWENTLGSMSHEFPGVGCFVAPPLFVDEEENDYRLLCDSPCIDTADPNLPWVDGTYVDRGGIQFGGWLYAPNPQPYCNGPLFGPGPQGYPSWVWFSIPFDAQWNPDGGEDYCCDNPDPSCNDPLALLGINCNTRLWYWDKYGKYSQVYSAPFITWNLEPGESYLLRLVKDPGWVYYKGRQPDLPFEFNLGKQGWTWIGMPRGAPLAAGTFMSSVKVKYPSDDAGVVRTAQQDYDQASSGWLSWGWAFYDTSLQAPKTFTPYLPFGFRNCYPWIGYRAWVKVGTAMNPDDPDQVTLIWPE
jgi:parallel beta-helix repeat protein